MSKVSIAEARDRLTRLIHEAEQGDAVHITRRGKPVAVIMSEVEYERLRSASARKSFWQAIQEMRADPEFEPVDFTAEEIDGWRNKTPGRVFSWED